MSKKIIFAVGLSLLAIAGCDSDTTTEPNDANAAEQQEKKPPAKNIITVAIPESAVNVDFPKGWYENPDEYPYDLQYFSKNQRMNTGVFLYDTGDFAAEIDADAILALQIEDLESKRDNFEEIQAVTKTELDDKTVTTAVFSGEKDSSRFYYKFAVIEFIENPDQLAVTLQVAIPSEWDKSKPVLEAITESMVIAAVPETETPTEDTGE
ncbi:hypothetical protein Lepto7376_1905 [[Leptolyngbya] sp. PCC 7376]|uniref:hypothetical protein n=1 Tax=[Leptolyngbya] sp. PCC 7376 TaxID=111781 RepID=UPI00029EF6AF|nr:hypothetical protein [[Leptolyngbya] sp. PCC 7376]AFY38222.1 hypothetical protein Lepto7376_1905 [[Leptolyngbya] sp. PCC 7376]